MSEEAKVDSAPSSKGGRGDLTQEMAPFMDLHLMFPLLDFLENEKLYPVMDISESRLELLKPTNMVDFALEVHASVHGGAEAKDLLARKDAVLAEMERFGTELDALLAVVEGGDLPALRACLQRGGDVSEAFPGVTKASIDELFAYAKFQHDCGDYFNAKQLLVYYLQLVPPSSPQYRLALWGRLAAEILTSDWSAALVSIDALAAVISQNPSVLEQLQQRSWLMHWSLFVFFNHQPDGRERLINLFLQPPFLHAMQSNAPWLLRYLTAAVVTSSRRKDVLKQLVKAIQLERGNYSDAVTEFVDCLYADFDFESAQAKLAQCEEVLNADFFLTFLRGQFVDSARRFIFETYCRMHSRVKISMLAEKLSLELEEAERWIVNLIRDAGLDAKIDISAGVVIMNARYPTVYERVLERTADLPWRTALMSRNLSRLLA